MSKSWRQALGADNTNVTVTGGITDSYKGELFGWVSAVDTITNKCIGRVSYTYVKSTDRVSIQFIEVVPEYRRQGIATKMRDFLTKEYPDAIIGALGNFLTDEGAAFENSKKE
jgi:ribosomal protein S18 acetylase RimI-like enzyme